MTIVVEVREARSALPIQKGNLGRCGIVSKSPITIIMPEMTQSAHVNHIEVFEAIAIVIGDGHSPAAVQVIVTPPTVLYILDYARYMHPSLHRRISETGRIEIGWKRGACKSKRVRGQDAVGCVEHLDTNSVATISARVLRSSHRTGGRDAGP